MVPKGHPNVEMHVPGTPPKNVWKNNPFLSLLFSFLFLLSFSDLMKSQFLKDVSGGFAVLSDFDVILGPKKRPKWEPKKRPKWEPEGE